MNIIISIVVGIILALSIINYIDHVNDSAYLKEHYWLTLTHGILFIPTGVCFAVFGLLTHIQLKY